MYKTITFSDFVDDLTTDNFSYGALHALWEYYESLEEDQGKEIEFCCGDIYCQWVEYETLQRLIDAYDYEHLEDMGREGVVDFFGQKTIIIDFEDGLLLKNDF